MNRARPADPPARLALLRQRYQAHLASPRRPGGAAPDDAQRGQDGRREGLVAGRETRRGLRQGAEWAALTAPIWSAFAKAWQETPEDVFVWSDLHLGHENIIRYANRPFGGTHHMDQSLLVHAQATVEDGQWLLCVGDLAMWKDRAAIERWMAQCPGRKLLVLGNHDVRGRERPQRLEDWQALGFEAVADAAVLPAAQGHPELWVTHYPLAPALVPEGVRNLHGHTHAHKVPGPFVNACVEHLDYRPTRLAALLGG